MTISSIIHLASEKTKAHFADGPLHLEVFTELGKGSPFTLAEKQVRAVLDKPEAAQKALAFAESNGEEKVAEALANNWKLLILERLAFYTKKGR